MRWSAAVLLVSATLLVSCGGGGPPLNADAGADFAVPMGEAPRFDGCRSTGNIVNYQWTIVSAPGAKAQDAGKALRELEANCAFTLEAQMHAEELGEWVIELEVTDAQGNTDKDTVVVTVTE